MMWKEGDATHKDATRVGPVPLVVRIPPTTFIPHCGSKAISPSRIRQTGQSRCRIVQRNIVEIHGLFDVHISCIPPLSSILPPQEKGICKRNISSPTPMCDVLEDIQFLLLSSCLYLYIFYEQRHFPSFITFVES